MGVAKGDTDSLPKVDSGELETLNTWKIEDSINMTVMFFKEE